MIFHKYIVSDGKMTETSIKMAVYTLPVVALTELAVTATVTLAIF